MFLGIHARLFQKITEKIVKNPIYKNAPQEVIENALEGVEKLMTTQVYQR